VDTESVARSPRTGTSPDPEDHERLLAAATAALRLLDRMDAHAPEGLSFGGESKVRRQLRQAIRCAER
jgi:hypothetical protein